MRVVNLSKGGVVNLSKSGLSRVTVGLGWTTSEFGPEYDLDASVFLLGRTGKVTKVEDFIYYKELVGGDGAVVHAGDNLEGGDGQTDDEQIHIDFGELPSVYQAIDVSVTIHEAEELGQTFGQVSNAYLRVVDEVTGQERVRYNLASDYSVETSVIMVRFERKGSEWEMQAIGEGLKGTLADVAGRYGIQAKY